MNSNLFNGAPVVNKGYYDVPICNQYSNKEIRDKPTITNAYALNRKINLTLNDNMGEYIVYQDPTTPSPSLYLETDQAMSGYYHKDPMNLAFDGTVPIPNKKDSKVYNYINSDEYPPFGIKSLENFEGHHSFSRHYYAKIFLIIFIIICTILFFSQ